MAQKFPFSMWVYNPMSDFTPDELEIWAECGMTIPHSPAVSYGKTDPATLIPFLDKAEELGMKLILNYGDFSYGSYIHLGAEEYERRFREVYGFFKGHPALYGFFAGDEPSGKESLAATIECYKIQKKVAPELEPYVNLIGGMASKSEEELGGKSFVEWFASLTGGTGKAIVSQDTYGPMINDNCVTDDIKALRQIVEAAEKAGVEVWGNMLSSAHYAYRKPNEHEILWQITVPAAMGCRGIIWFRFYDRTIGHEYFGSPIDEYGNKTDTYYSILRSQKRFNDQYGELLMRLKRKSTFMRGKDRGAYPVFEKGSHDLIDINCYEDAVISFFEDEDGREYMCIVNAYMDMHATIKIGYDREKCALYEVTLNGARERYYAPIDPKDEWGGLALYAGQMRMFRIERK